MKIHDLGVPLFLETPISSPCRIRFFHFQAMWSRLYRRWDRGRGGTVCEYLGWNEPETIKLGSQQSILLRTICRRKNYISKCIQQKHGGQSTPKVPSRLTILITKLSNFFVSLNFYFWNLFEQRCWNSPTSSSRMSSPKKPRKELQCHGHNWMWDASQEEFTRWGLINFAAAAGAAELQDSIEMWWDIWRRYCSFEDFQRFPHTVQS